MGFLLHINQLLYATGSTLRPARTSGYNKFSMVIQASKTPPSISSSIRMIRNLFNMALHLPFSLHLPMQYINSRKQETERHLSKRSTFVRPTCRKLNILAAECYLLHHTSNRWQFR